MPGPLTWGGLEEENFLWQGSVESMVWCLASKAHPRPSLVNTREEGEGGEGEILPHARVPAAVRDEITDHGGECRIPLPFPRPDDLSEIKQINSVSSEEVCLTALIQWLYCFRWNQVIQFIIDIVTKRFCPWIFLWYNFVRCGLDMPLHTVEKKNKRQRACSPECWDNIGAIDDCVVVIPVRARGLNKVVMIKVHL